ncbi:hypothetical protein KP509_01G060700 [Ceratopteris richardii]|uniref:Uncharacterized protein n=1 Tax=Ceratopteris richardii TaxID=49495 RepID=A0A8T2VK77_CERRI|nr:hypothetical protein KP509_01G060700 [Ceratopteris richardii]KAH7446524.1 hypothetical protein KP509_01G060700 [Ceratopteris richardii]KAH7446525.1 hypothetical protein KP509_01G060700 [Ceratopteris richardii]
MAAGSKVTRSFSSLSHSPSIKVSMSTLSSLDKSQYLKNISRNDHVQHQNAPKKYRKPKLWVFLLPFTALALPCIYLYESFSNHVDVAFLEDNGQLVAGFWLYYIFLVFLFSSMLVAIMVVYPRPNLVYRLKCSLSSNWGCLIMTCLKPLGGMRTCEKDRHREYGSSCVTWTIGSEPKLHRLKSIKEGIQTYSNGDTYAGEFHQGRFSGSGVYHFHFSGRYEGDWVDGKFDGYGVETWARGSWYRGQFRCGLREGCGVYRFFTDDVYSGEWSKGQSHGRGIQTCADGSRYVGEFKWGTKHGFGCYYFRNGDTFSGEYFADKMHGYGVYQFANGHRYEGAWHEGKRQGLGVYEFRNGERQSGHWQDGSLQIHSSHLIVGGAPQALSHSKVLHAVQEARRASTKALQVLHVDIRVNKAVAAANKAASAARIAAARAVQSSRLDGTGHSLDLHEANEGHDKQGN